MKIIYKIVIGVLLAMSVGWADDKPVDLWSLDYSATLKKSKASGKPALVSCVTGRLGYVPCARTPAAALQASTAIRKRYMNRLRDDDFDPKRRSRYSPENRGDPICPRTPAVSFP